MALLALGLSVNTHAGPPFQRSPLSAAPPPPPLPVSPSHITLPLPRPSLQVLVSQKVTTGVYKGVTTSELDELAAETAASLTATHPDYALVREHGEGVWG